MLRVFKNSMLRKIVLKRYGETGEWRGLHNQELLCCVLLTKYHLGDQIKKKRWAWHVAHMGDRRGAYWILVGDLRDGEHLKTWA